MRKYNLGKAWWIVTPWLKGEFQTVTLAEVSAQKCADPCAPAFWHRKNDDFTTGKCTGATAEVTPRPSCSWPPPSRSPDGFVCGWKARKRSRPALLVNGGLVRLSSAQRLRCYVNCHSDGLYERLGLLHQTPKRGICSSTIIWGRTGFDSSLEAQAACRGRFVGLVKNRTKKINADHEDVPLAA